jgi:hypothetical protein
MRWNGPLRFRKSMIDLAVFGPMPGRVSSWAIVAVFRLMGWTGGVFWARAMLEQRKRTMAVMSEVISIRDRKTVMTKGGKPVDSALPVVVRARHAVPLLKDGECYVCLVPLAVYSVTGPNKVAWSKIWSRSPTRMIWALAESKWRRAASKISSAVRARIFSR